MTERADPFIGQVVGGRYEVLARIGRGAMGTIYEVRHTKLKRNFALKRLMPHLADDAEALERFHREADVVAALRHPNVVEIVDWETLDDGTPCMVMELLRGENLEQRLARHKPLPMPEILFIADHVLAALSVAHRAGIVHRDLKPQNIFITRDDSGEERIKLLDFGISKVQGSGHTSAGAVMGTPAYMSPEQADSRADDIGPVTDLWAMGAILYELACGEQPFTGLSPSAVLYKVCYGQYEPLDKRVPDLDARYVALVDRLLQKRVVDRMDDVEDLRLELRLVGMDKTVVRAAPRAPAPEPSIATDVEHTAVNSTTLSRSVGQSVEVPVAPPSRTVVWPWLASAAAVIAIVAGFALRKPTTTAVVPAVPLRVDAAVAVERVVVPAPGAIEAKPIEKPVEALRPPPIKKPRATPKPAKPPVTKPPVKKNDTPRPFDL